MRKAAAAGEAAVSGQLSMKLIERLRVVPEAEVGRPGTQRATSREWEILDLLCSGASTDRIADTLVLSAETAGRTSRTCFALLAPGGPGPQRQRRARRRRRSTARAQRVRPARRSVRTDSRGRAGRGAMATASSRERAPSMRCLSSPPARLEVCRNVLAAEWGRYLTQDREILVAAVTGRAPIPRSEHEPGSADRPGARGARPATHLTRRPR